MVDKRQVAEWMKVQLDKERYLYQEEVAFAIANEFGDEFVYENENCNLAIDRSVLAEFRKLTPDNVVWSRGDRCWRFRESHDPLGKRETE